MKKSNATSLATKLAKYTAVIGAIAAGADANGQIIYTDIDPDFEGSTDNYELDLNNDGTPDFLVQPITFTSGTFQLDIYDVSYSTSNAVAVVSSSDINTKAFIEGETVNDTFPFYGGEASLGSFYTIPNDGCNGNWCDGEDKFAGLRFMIEDQFHFGWVRISFDGANGAWVVKDYAYEATAETPIPISIPLSIDEFDNALNRINIAAVNKTVTINNIEEDATYAIYDLTGKKVLKGDLKKATEVIPTGEVAQGIYIVEIKSANSSARITKKIIL